MLISSSNCFMCFQMDRCECCDIIGMDNLMAEVRLRECMTDEIIA